MSTDPTKRFSSRVEDYIKYRPHYPQAVVELLRDECGLTNESIIADVGSGTGILSELFLRNGNRVFGVEPNREMREAGERMLSTYGNFLSVEGRAEATTLESESVDFVTAGQAFHWFDIEGARREFRRVLRPGGWVVALWNDRRIEGTPFLEDYERMLVEYSADYCEVSSKHSDEDALGKFFGAGGFLTKRFANHQALDFESMKGRLRSSSYTPEPGHPNFEPMMREFASIFERHQAGARIVVEYDTKVFYGRLDARATA
ncbi:MAG TPA: class I SAM-dependent methyltransferase [Pyrinomonadaceae bacterium]|nr:class I SAM-dependent methyltransferase [Pyrinomonadaceae bacterium]